MMQTASKTKTTTKRADTSASVVFRSAANKDKEKDPVQGKFFKAALKPMRVSSPDDPEEKEADATADKVMRMAEKEETPVSSSQPAISTKKQEEEDTSIKRQTMPELARKAQGSVNMKANVQADINRAMSDGSPLPLSVRKFMEPRFKADFSKIKIHTDTTAAKLNRRLSAKAFAYKEHVFFAENQFKPDSKDGKQLIAHELTHSIQQGAAPQQQQSTTKQTESTAKTTNKSSATTNSPALSRKAEVTHRTQPSIQRLGVQDALDFFADAAYLIPGFRMLCILLGRNPISGSRVERSAANILRAVVEFLPGGIIITTVLDRYGLFERAGNWINEQLDSLNLTYDSLSRSLSRFLDSLSWSDIFDLDGVWQRAKRIFTEPIDRIVRFARNLFNTIKQMIKDAVLIPLAQWASQTRGWDLLCAVLGRNPITDEVVERSPENLIGGFMKFIGQEEVWENIKRANAIPRAWVWFQTALAGISRLVRGIPLTLMRIFEALRVADLLNIPEVFARILGTFANFAINFIRWAGGTVADLLKIIFEVLAPGMMPYLRRARGSLMSIIRNPIDFVKNLIRAGVLGFRQFAQRFLRHLRTGFINWLTGSLAGTGVHIPTSFSLTEIIKFVLSVLGVTWQRIRQKLVTKVGEPAVTAMERGFDIVRKLVTEGPMALWEQLKETLANLRDTAIERIMNFVLERVVQSAVTRIISMLNPAGAFIQAIMAIYNTIMFFVERMRTIIQVAQSFLNSIMDIAAGRLAPAAARVEQTLAGMLSLAISFLARFIGLGGISGHISRILTRIRAPIDRALNSAIDWVVRQARRIGGFIMQAGVPRDPRIRLRRGLDAAKAIVRRLPTNGLGEAVIVRALRVIKERYGFQQLIPRIKNGSWWIFAKINPELDENSGKAANGATEQQVAGNMPDIVDVLDPSDTLLIRQYSRERRSGEFTNAIHNGNQVTLSKVGFQRDNEYVKQAVGSQQSVKYTISEASDKYPTPPRIVGIVDSGNPEEATTYDQHRRAFGTTKRRWWRGDEPTSPNVAWLIEKGWLLPGDKKGLQSGTRKWRFIRNLFNAEEAKFYGNKSASKANMLAAFDQHPNKFRVETFYQAWDRRIAEQTEIHHLLPLDFGGTNNQTFIPLSRDMHTKDGSKSIHLAFWNPMKRWLLGLRGAQA
ncbi:eCIS core domain-containing protein [Glaciecola sp. 1036]|uniref:eCIS core domain-containing protein n=1 Tax=Alteromonadaceae TaxID=72275 RepID=UPI003D018E87